MFKNYIGPCLGMNVEVLRGILQEAERRQYEGHNTLQAIILTKAHRDVVSMMAKGCIEA